MTIEELVKKGVLKAIHVKKLYDDVMDAGNKRFISEFNIPKSGGGPQRMRFGYCQDNSICVVDAMRDKGEYDWHIVPGFAFNTEVKDPIIHVWVRNRSRHYDPTWSLDLDLSKYNPEDCRYFQVVQSLVTCQWKLGADNQGKIAVWGKSILVELEDLASQWGLKVAIRD